MKFQMSPILQKVTKPFRPLLMCQKMIWHKLVSSVKEVTVTSVINTSELLFSQEYKQYV